MSRVQSPGLLLTHGETVNERVAGVSRGTPANGIVIAHGAQRVPAAGVLAGVAASRVHAGLALAAVGADEALGSAAGRNTQVTGQAGTGGLLAEHAADAVGSAGRGLAGFHARYARERQNDPSKKKQLVVSYFFSRGKNIFFPR